MASAQVELPEQSPDQPAKVDPAAGVAVRTTLVPEAKVAEHVVPQLMPVGELATVPVPAPPLETVRVRSVFSAVYDATSVTPV